MPSFPQKKVCTKPGVVHTAGDERRRVRLPDRAPGEEHVQLKVCFRAQLAHGIYRIRARLVQAPTLHQEHLVWENVKPSQRSYK